MAVVLGVWRRCGEVGVGRWDGFEGGRAGGARKVVVAKRSVRGGAKLGGRIAEEVASCVGGGTWRWEGSGEVPILTQR